MLIKLKNLFCRVSSRNWLIFLMIVVVTVGLDQLSKYWILGKFSGGENESIIPGVFNLTLTYNKGAAFGFLAGVQDGHRELLLALTTTLALLVVFYFFLVEYWNDLVAQVALAMIVGGALGNIIDRMRIGMVVDFLDFYFNNYHWPAFNLADSFICVGVVILIFRKPMGMKSAVAAE